MSVKLEYRKSLGIKNKRESREGAFINDLEFMPRTLNFSVCLKTHGLLGQSIVFTK